MEKEVSMQFLYFSTMWHIVLALAVEYHRWRASIKWATSLPSLVSLWMKKGWSLEHQSSFEINGHPYQK